MHLPSKHLVNAYNALDIAGTAGDIIAAKVAEGALTSRSPDPMPPPLRGAGRKVTCKL